MYYLWSVRKMGQIWLFNLLFSHRVVEKPGHVYRLSLFGSIDLMCSLLLFVCLCLSCSCYLLVQMSVWQFRVSCVEYIGLICKCIITQLPGVCGAPVLLETRLWDQVDCTSEEKLISGFCEVRGNKSLKMTPSDSLVVAVK